MQTPFPPQQDTEDDLRRGPRYPFLVDIEVTDVQSGIRLTGQTTDVSLFGCGVNTKHPLPKGTSVQIKITHGGATFEALGRVAYARPDLGMGIAFTAVEPERDRILGWWLADLEVGADPSAQGGKQ